MAVAGATVKSEGAPAPIIVSALFGRADFAWLDGQRRAHFPPERNRLAAHLTLFHHLPPSAAEELRALLRELTAGASPAARLAGVMNLGGGVAYRVESDGLAEIRARIAHRFEGLLTPQDRAGWRPHITVQNKVPAETARALYRELAAAFIARPLAISGVAAWWYRGGPWELLSEHRFRR